MASILSRMFGRKVEKRTDSEVFNLIDGGNPFAGIGHIAASPHANQEALAMTVACVEAISSGLGSLPPRVYRADENGRTEVTAGAVARLFKRPNNHATWPELMAWLMGSVLLWGNGLLALQWNGRGEPTGLIPVQWSGVAVTLTTAGEIVYEVPVVNFALGMPVDAPVYDLSNGRGKVVRLLGADVIHLKERSDNGLIGRPRLARCPEVLDAARHLQTFAASMFRNGATLSGIVSLPPSITPAGLRRLEAGFNEQHVGADRAHRFLFADKDTEFTPLSSNAEESQALESRRFTGEEIARIFQTPPSIVGDLTHGTFTNSETAGRWFAQFCLSPWARRIEAVFDRALFPDGSNMSTELDLSTLLRGSDTERWQNWAIALDRGVLSPADVRAAEGWSGTPPEPVAPVAPAASTTPDA